MPPALPLVLMLSFTAFAADVCNPNDFQGAYGFQLSGTSKISGGESKPVAGVGLMVLDGSGGVSGTSSVTFGGLLLGNPVNGTYEAHPDCSVSWALQDDSGAYQHFAGTISPDGKRAQFRQTDPGGEGERGIAVKTSDNCTDTDIQEHYNVTTSASKEPVDVDKNAIQLEDACFVHATLIIPPVSTINLRGILVNGGKEILAIQTDPGTSVTAKFVAR